MGQPGELLQIHVLRLGHPPRVDLKDLQATLLVGDADLDLPIESPGPAEGRIQGVGPVRGANDHHLPPGLQPVHGAEKLGHHAALHLPRDLVPLGGDGVDLIDEDDAGGSLLRLGEDVPQVLLALAVVLGHDLRAGDGEEGSGGLAGDGLRQEGLPRPGRAVEQDALGRFHAQTVKDLRVAKGELDHLPDLLHLLVEAADVLVGYPGELQLFRRGALADLDACPVLHEDRVRRWRDPHNRKLQLAPHDVDLHHIPPRERPPFQELQQVQPSARDSQGLRGRQGDLLRRLGIDARHAHLLIQAHTGVASEVPVHPNDAPILILRVAVPADGHRPVLALDGEDVAGGELQGLHDRRVHADNASAHVLGPRLRHPQHLFRHGASHVRVCGILC